MQVGKNRQGFTIVELLIVIVVIAILAAITIVAYNGIQNRAKASAAQSAASQVSKKVLAYAVTNNDSYPGALSDIAVSNSGGTTYQYSVDNTASPRTYCVTATTSNISYYVSTTQTTPLAGACFGHGLNGNTAITNLVPNPSFESNTTGWSVSSNISQSYELSGGAQGVRYHSGSRTSTAAIGLYSPQFPVNGNDTYTGLASVRAPVGRQAFLRFTWYDGVGGSTSSAGSPIAGSGAWQSQTYTATAPANTVNGRLDIVMNTVGSVVGDVLAVDGAMVTSGATVYAYADGSSAGWSWSGTANNSSSSGPPL